MLKPILDAVTTVFAVAAAFFFWNLANKFGDRISVKKFLLILIGLALMLLAIGWL